ncbi:MAG: bifunctional adenosylcobinamide kinase/adenosylcobinamide-phosphate guanylyltransferase, partial [Dehalococcoidia bacterium]|nr:bifunctional adenosylcobinamide kinase/adenosylcobinamide-phosphate guanylyltransferase [Dehalococcoidia bacterium]
RLHSYDTIIVDCLTLWVSNLLLMARGTPSATIDLVSETRRLLDLFRKGSASWVVVSNEVGLGVVPATELGRIYADELGRVNQAVAAESDEVFFMAAGLALKIKSNAARQS